MRDTWLQSCLKVWIAIDRLKRGARSIAAAACATWLSRSEQLLNHSHGSALDAMWLCVKH